jgi:hypothetical protein
MDIKPTKLEDIVQIAAMYQMLKQQLYYVMIRFDNKCKDHYFSNW